MAEGEGGRRGIGDEPTDELTFVSSLLPLSFSFPSRSRWILLRWQLNDGVEIPILGLGVYEMTDDETEKAVYWALEVSSGFRTFFVRS